MTAPSAPAVLLRAAPLLGYILTIVAANWAIQTFGLVPVGLGLLAPAGVYFAGIAFTLRDLTQETLGRWWTLAAIGAGALLSLAVSDAAFALASGLAFLLSELADFAVYTPLRSAIGWGRGPVQHGRVTGRLVPVPLARLRQPGLPGRAGGRQAWMTAGRGVLWIWRGRGSVLAGHASPGVAGRD
jgi:hypothetical protein